MATKAELEQENNELKESLNKMQEQFTQMQQMMEQMQTMQNGNTTIINNSNDISNKKVTVVSLLSHLAILSTEQFGGGMSYQFNGYGSTRKIKYSDLEKIVSLTKQLSDMANIPLSFFERGDFYIADKDVVEELGLDMYYDKILTPQKVNEIIALKDDTAVELFRGANDSIRDSVMGKIADNIISGQEYDRGLLVRLNDIWGKDIDALVKQKEKLIKK